MVRRLTGLFAIVAAVSVLLLAVGVVSLAGFTRQETAESRLSEELSEVASLLDSNAQTPRRAGRLRALGGLDSFDLVAIDNGGDVTLLTGPQNDLVIPSLTEQQQETLIGEGFVSLDVTTITDGGETLSDDVAGLQSVSVLSDSVSNGNIAIFGSSQVELLSRELFGWFIFSFVVAVLLAALIGWLMARRIARPILKIEQATADIASGQFNNKLELSGPPELVSLGTSVNQMTDRLQQSKEADRQFLLSVSHDLKTPLTVVKGYAEVLSSGADIDRIEIGNKIGAHSQRLETMVTDILDLAKLGSNRFAFDLARYDLGNQIRELDDGWQLLAVEHGIALNVSSSGNCFVEADPVRIAQIMDNLVSNALKFARSKVDVVIQRDAGRVDVEVVDDGPGIKPENIGKVFDSYYSLSADGDSLNQGSGLGLAVAKQLALKMGGSLEVKSSTSSGSTMLMTLQTV